MNVLRISIPTEQHDIDDMRTESTEDPEGPLLMVTIFAIGHCFLLLAISV